MNPGINENKKLLCHVKVKFKNDETMSGGSAESLTPIFNQSDISFDNEKNAVYLTTKETCKFFNISKSTLQRYCKLGLPVFKVNGKLLFKVNELMEFIKEKKEVVQIFEEKTNAEPLDTNERKDLKC